MRAGKVRIFAPRNITTAFAVSFSHMKKTVLLLLAASLHAGVEHQSAPYFRLLDHNGDAKITADEVRRSPWADKLDEDKDGAVSAVEFGAGWDAYAELRSTLTKLFPQVAAPATPKPEDSPRQAARVLPPNEAGIGTLIPDLTANDLHARARKLSEFGGSKALVIACVSTSCPVSKRFLPTLAALEKEYATRGVAFLLVAPTKSDKDADLRAALSDAKLAAPCLRDPQGVLLKTLGATATTDCFLLDSRRTLIYRGAVDDQYGLGYSLSAPRTRLLSLALEATLAGRPPAIAATEAPGCVLDLSASKPAVLGSATYHNRISRILQQNCLECHRTGGVAPFTLAAYEEVTEHAGMIRKMVERRLMPPWFAAPLPGAHSPWANDRSLPERDRIDLLEWLAAGRPLGNVKDAPLPRTWPAEEWAIGKPDAIFQIPAPIAVAATGTMPYQTVRIPTSATETRYVQAIEVLPTDRSVVHHILVFADVPGARRGDAERGGIFAIYVPGNSTLIYPEGFAKALPAGAVLRFQIHYTPNGKATSDQCRIGLRYAPGAPLHLVENVGITTNRFAIPPGHAHYPVTATLPVPRAARLLSLHVHMHLRGSAWHYEVTTPDGQTRTLLDVPRYDFNWQLRYLYAEPLALAAGSVIRATAWYDNSAANPANPDPTKTVRWGQQTDEEMMLGYVEYYFP